MRILVRYGEIGVKSRQVQRSFLDRLKQNLQQALDAATIEGTVSEDEDRIFAEVAEADAADATLTLSHVPGVVSLSPVVTTSTDFDDIITTLTGLAGGTNAETFAVEARRAGDHHDYRSQDIKEEAGDRTREEHGLVVDLDDPDLTVSVEARYQHAYCYTETVQGVGGLPIGERNRVAVLMEDRASTVAAFRLMKRGCTVHPVYTGQEAGQLREEMDTLRQYDPGVKLTVLKQQDPDEALETVCDLYNCDAVAYGTTSNDLDSGVPDHEREVLLPNSGYTTEEVLDTYTEIQHVVL